MLVRGLKLSIYEKGWGMVEWVSERKDSYIILRRKGKRKIMRILESRKDLTAMNRTNIIFSAQHNCAFFSENEYILDG